MRQLDGLSVICILIIVSLPLSVLYSDSHRLDLQTWIDNRSVSANRKDVSLMLEAFQVETPSALSFKSLGLNLSDQYWCRIKTKKRHTVYVKPLLHWIPSMFRHWKWYRKSWQVAASRVKIILFPSVVQTA